MLFQAELLQLPLICLLTYHLGVEPTPDRVDLLVLQQTIAVLGVAQNIPATDVAGFSTGRQVQFHRNNL